MSQGTLYLGFELWIPKENVEFIMSADSLPQSVRGMIRQKAEEGKLVDATRGKKRKSIVLTRTGYLYFSHNTAKKIQERFDEISGE